MLNVDRKYIYALAFLFILCCVLAVSEYAVKAAAEEDVKWIIALDPGHGGEEEGACYYGMEEKDVNLKLAKLVKSGLEEYKGVKVVLTREGDETLSLGQRALRAKEQNADILISLHQNASLFHKSQGSTIYISTAENYREQLFQMADYLLGEFEALGLQNDGTIARVTQMGRRRADGSFDDYYGVLRHGYNNGMPALLIEHCFMDSKEDHTFLETEEGIMQLAQADINGIASFYNLEKKDGSVHVKKQAKQYGATTRGIAMDYYEPPEITGLQLTDFNGISPSIATYQVTINDGAGVDSIGLVYKNGAGETASVSLKLTDKLTTGTYELKAYIPEMMRKSDYQLSYIGIHNRAGYEAGYNRAGGEMIGFGKCNWTNRFAYMGEADLQIKEQGNIDWTKSRWMDYEVSIGIRDRRRFFVGRLYPD